MPIKVVPMKPLSHHQIIVIGAGPVGMLCALSLHQQGKSVLLVEARAAAAAVADQRTIALSYHSVKAFQAAGVVLEDAMLTPITTVHVSRQHHFGRTLLTATDVDLPYLGATVDYTALLRQCEAALVEQQVPVAWESPVHKLATLSHWAEVTIQKTNGDNQAVTAEWVVLAEGGQLATQLPRLTRRSHDYQQMALVNQLRFSKPSAGAAYERFTDAGPLALLPYGDDFKLVWTCSKAEATARMHMDCATFADRLQAIMGERLGNLTHMGEPATFPLRLRQLNRVYSGRVICIGNAAQTMHPVAAQGLNLGVRDAECLAALLGASVRLDEPALAARYAAARQVDAHAIVGFTHGLVMLFDHPLPWLQWGQSAGMALLGSVPAWRRAFTKQLVFGV